MAARSNTRIANEAWEALFRAQATIARELPAARSGASLTRANTACCTRCRTRPDGLRITELGEDVLLSQPGMSRLIARLEAAGSSAGSTIPSDARACRVRLTESGVRAQRAVGLAHGRHVAQLMTRSLDRDELVQTA